MKTKKRTWLYRLVKVRFWVWAVLGILLWILPVQGWGQSLSPAQKEIEQLFQDEKYAIVLEKALGILNTGKDTISPSAGAFLHYYVGMAYKKSGDSKNAADYFKKIEQQYPGSDYIKPALIELAEIYKGDYFQEVAYLEKVYSQYPRTPEAVQASIKLCEGYIRLKNFRKALPILETVVNVWKEGDAHPELYMLLAVSYSGLNDYIEALEYLRQTEKKIPGIIEKNPGYLFEAGKISHNNLNFDKGVIYLEKLFNVYPDFKDHAEAAILLAQCYEREKKLFLSAVFLIKALEKKPAQRYLHTLMLTLGRVLGDLDEKELKKIKQNYPLYADSRKLLMLVKNNSLDFEQRRMATILLSGELKKSNNLEKAVDNYHKFLKEQGDPVIEKLFKENVDRYLDDLKEKKDYEQMFQVWIKLKSRKSFLSAENLLRFGELMYRMKLYANARDVYQHIIKYKMYSKYWQTALGQLVRIDFNLGQYPECLNHMARLNLENELEQSEFTYYRLVAFQQLKQDQEAEDILNEIIPDAIGNIFQFRLYREKARDLEKKRDYDEALKYYRLLEGYQPVPEPDRGLVMIALGDVLFIKKDYAAADDYYRQAETMNINIEWVLFRRIKIARLQKQEEVGVALLEKLKQVKPDSFWLRQLDKDVR